MASTAASTVVSTALHGSNSPALKFRVVAECSRSRARVSVMTLPHNTVNLPTFMPVGTKGTMKGLIPQQVKEAGAEIILGNTYHLGTRPGKETMETLGGLHKMMGWDRPLLTDSGGFQMVSLSALTKITEEGVTFQSPFDGSEILLTPEESISIQNTIGADIMMQLDDVVNVVETDYERFKTATYRTTRWLDRCMAANKNPEEQNLFPIIQGGLFPDLRDISLAELTARDAPGFAIGGLSGGEEKDKFWKVVHQCTGRLPRSKPRYCMGVGFAVDLVVCCALGVDMYDCVFPTRTARFGCGLVEGGQINLKMKQYASDFRAIDDTCDCSTCTNYTRAYLHTIVTRYPVACHLVSIHNIAYQMRLMRNIRTSITEGRFPEFVQDFMAGYYPDGNYPGWLTDALNAVNIQLRMTVNTVSQDKEARTPNPAAGESIQEHTGGATVETVDSDRKTEGNALRNKDTNVLGSEAVDRKRKIEAKEVKENYKKEVVDRKRRIGAEVFEDDDDEEWEGAGEIAAQRSGFDKLHQTGYREGVLDEYPDQEASGRAAGWQVGLNFLRSDPSLVLAPSSLSRTHSDHKAQSDPNRSLAHSILSSVEPCAKPTMTSTKIFTAHPNLNPVFALAKLSGALLACRAKLDLNPEQDSQAAELLKEIEVEVARISQSPPIYVLEEWKLGEAGAEGRKGGGEGENRDSERKKMEEKQVSNKERIGCKGEEGTCKGACGNREAEQYVIDLEQSGSDRNNSGKEQSQQEKSTKPTLSITYTSVTTTAANPEGETTKRRLRSLQDRVHALYQIVGWTLPEF